jgi:hypothetical protein
VVIVEEPPEPHSPDDRSRVGSVSRLGVDDLAAETLVRPLAMIVLDERQDHAPETGLSERDDP